MSQRYYMTDEVFGADRSMRITEIRDSTMPVGRRTSAMCYDRITATKLCEFLNWSSADESRKAKREANKLHTAGRGSSDLHESHSPDPEPIAAAGDQ